MTYGDVLRGFSNEQLADYIANYAVGIRHKFLEDRNCADLEPNDKENIKNGLLLALSRDVPGTVENAPKFQSEEPASYPQEEVGTQEPEIQEPEIVEPEVVEPEIVEPDVEVVEPEEIPEAAGVPESVIS